jgi:hypothetical protein
MEQSAVEWLEREMLKPNLSMRDILDQAKKIETELSNKKQGYSEEEMLKMLQKFGFDYTYNYRGGKTIYEWIPEWFEEQKRLEQLKK